MLLVGLRSTMTRLAWTLIWFVAIGLTIAHAQTCCDSEQQSFGFQDAQQGLIPMPNGGALLMPITPNAYGLGLNSDATGRAFIWRPEGSHSTFSDPTLQVKPNAYGLGIGMDQYGRPVRACPLGWSPC